MDPAAHSALLARSWTEVAAPYLRVFAPRFAPWTRDALAALLEARPPPAARILVPACGPGQELPMLAEALPDSRILGIDLSEGMVQEAQRQIEAAGLGHRVTVAAGDATRLDTWTAEGAPGAIFSCFGLQQMPQPSRVLAEWTRVLQPGGVLAVCFWPRRVEDDGPFQRLFELSADTQARNADWEADIPGAALAEGAELLLDTLRLHPMSWPSLDGPGSFWDGMVNAGPWHSRLLAQGEAAMAELRSRFMAEYPDPCAPLTHAPCARLIVLRKRRDGGVPPPSAAL